MYALMLMYKLAVNNWTGLKGYTVSVNDCGSTAAPAPA